jgi:mannose-6-phosphate isomerase-like protein (cupin superfamily)
MNHRLAVGISILAVSGQGRATPLPQAPGIATSDAKQSFFAVPPGGSRSPGDTGAIAVKVSGADNGGAFAVLEVPTVVDSGPPLHLHHVENEWFYALEGEYDIKVGEQIFNLKPGGSVYAPKMIPHTWHDVGDIVPQLGIGQCGSPDIGVRGTKKSRRQGFDSCEPAAQADDDEFREDQAARSSQLILSCVPLR